MVTYTFKILLTGDSEVGKSMFARKNTDTGIDTSITLGAAFYEKALNTGGEDIRLIFWELNGGGRFRKLMKKLYTGALCAVIMFDLTRETTFFSVKEYVDKIKESCGDVPIIIVGNKVELKRERDVPGVLGRKLAKICDAEYIEISARDGKNVDAVLDLIAEKVLSSRES